MAGELAAGTPMASRRSHRVRFGRRLYGLGSVFGKTLRDSRGGLLAVTGLLAGMVIAGGWAMTTTYGTATARADLAAMSANMPPVLRGLYGNPVKVDTLGGFLSWHYGAYFAMIGGLWSILALSSTLAAEARRGSLDLVVVTPRSRRSVALQKAAAHIAALTIAAMAVGVAAWATGAVLTTFEGDAISPVAAAGFAIGVLLRSLVAGSVAFALAPIVGRGAAAGLAGALMLGGYVAYSYRTVVDVFDTVDGLTWFSWAAGHIPLAGQWDSPAMALTGAVAAALIGIGVEAFARRDVGVTVPLPLPRLPRRLLGLRGPLGRTFGDLLPSAIGWGIGLGLYGVVMSGASGAVADLLNASAELKAIIASYIPGVDLSTAAGLLQFAFVDMGFVVIGLAAASLVGARCGDEAAGRLELQLTTPLTRARWAIGSAAAIDLAVLLITGVLAAAIVLGVASLGQDPLGPGAGTAVLALYGWAMAGIGVAVSGVSGPRWAATVMVAIVIVTSLIDLLAPALKLPGWVEQLALTHHLGQSMIGRWDLAGITACLALAVGGTLIGAWGMSRRDIAR